MLSVAPFALRRAFLSLAITQLVMCTVVPLHASGTTSDRGDARIERQQTPAGVPVHDPESCPVCQLLTAQFLRPEASYVAPITQSVQIPQGASTALPVARAPPAAHQTRAPPLPLV